jgi:hypothetical protein
MLLELGKAISFLLCILSLYPVLMSAFFELNTSWQERLMSALAKLLIAACVSLCSGLLFIWPARSNPDRNQSLLSTLPVRVFLWATAGLTVLFFLTWYVRCGGQNSFGIKHDCF